MNPNLMHQVAQARQADLLREAEEYRRAGLTAGPTVLIRIIARIPRFPTRSRRRRAHVVVPSAPGREFLTRSGADERFGDPVAACAHSTNGVHTTSG